LPNPQPERIFLDDQVLCPSDRTPPGVPKANVGDRIDRVVGVLDYGFTNRLLIRMGRRAILSREGAIRVLATSAPDR
jgi:hypothetical protein